jgi:hypothetical protein
MAKSKTKIDTSRGRAAAKASAATKKTADFNASKNTKTGARTKSAAQAPASSDIRHAYKKSLLGKYLDKHRGQPAIKPKR